MKNSYLLTLLLFVVGIITSGTQCRKEYSYPSPPKPVYEFDEKLSLSPFKKSYAIGDTIWITFERPDKTLYDKITGRMITNDTTFLSVFLSIDRQYPQENNFDLPGTIKVENGTNVNFSSYLPGRNNLEFRTECNNSYFFKAALVVNKKGVFTITPGALVSACPDKKEIVPTSLMFAFDLADCNKDVWLLIAEEARGYSVNYTDVGIDRKQVFAFKVE